MTWSSSSSHCLKLTSRFLLLTTASIPIRQGLVPHRHTSLVIQRYALTPTDTPLRPQGNSGIFVSINGGFGEISGVELAFVKCVKFFILVHNSLLIAVPLYSDWYRVLPENFMLSRYGPLGFENTLLIQYAAMNASDSHMDAILRALVCPKLLNNSPSNSSKVHSNSEIGSQVCIFQFY